MQQLSFLEAPVPEGAAPAWNALDEEQRAEADKDARPADREDDR